MKYLKVFNESSEFNNLWIDYSNFGNNRCFDIPISVSEELKIREFFTKFGLDFYSTSTNPNIIYVKNKESTYYRFYKVEDEYFYLECFIISTRYFKCDGLDGLFDLITNQLMSSSIFNKSLKDKNKLKKIAIDLLDDIDIDELDKVIDFIKNMNK